jgi:hypothetical protein
MYIARPSPKNLLCIGWAIAGFFIATSAGALDELGWANHEADSFIHRYFKILGNDAFSRYQVGPAPGFPSDSWTAEYRQFHGFRWELKEQSPSSADQLNGITWKGIIGIKSDAYRKLTEQHGGIPPPEPPCWGAWQDMPKWEDQSLYDFIWPLTHINGVWKIGLENSGHWFSWSTDEITGENSGAPQFAPGAPSC